MNFNSKAVTLLTILIPFNLVAGQAIGDDCVSRNGQMGKCEHISKCKSARDELKISQKPLICSFNKSDVFPIVCCQKTTDNSGLASSNLRSSADIIDQKCEEYFREINNRQLSFVAAVNGVNALPKEYPHMAILGYGNGNNIEWQCGGSLISEQFVLTAAHCLYSREYGDVTDVRLGDLDIGSTTDDASPQDFKVAKTFPHPEYSTDSHYHDVALIRLDRPANLTRHVMPACLQTKHELETNTLSATGWGATYYGGGTHSFLQKVQLNNLPVQTCHATYKPETRLLRGVDEQLQICAGNQEKSMDTCQGDSGGPLQRTQSNSPLIYRIVGITSFGKDCGLVPAIYTRVSTYIQWISSIVWP